MRMLISRETRGWRRFGHISMQACHEITPPQIVADAMSAIFRQAQNFIGRQNSVPHVHAIHVT